MKKSRDTQKVYGKDPKVQFANGYESSLELQLLCGMQIFVCSEYSETCQCKEGRTDSQIFFYKKRIAQALEGLDDRPILEKQQIAIDTLHLQPKGGWDKNLPKVLALCYLILESHHETSLSLCFNT